jgi:bacteriocin-type transport-associated protein
MQKVLYILGELSDEDINWLVEVGSREEIAPGTILIREGQPVDTLYILLAGALIVSISALEGRQIAKLATGEVVGEMSFIDASPPSATVQTLEESVVLAIPRAKLSEKLNQDVAFAARFYRALAILLSQRLRGTVKQLGDEKAKSDEKESNHASVAPMGNSAIAQVRFNQLLEKLMGVQG